MVAKTQQKKDIAQLIRVRGIVQGVGFRPFVYQIANKYGLTGWVKNDHEGVLIFLQGSCHASNQFLFDLRHKKPPLSNIDSIEIGESAFDWNIKGFSINKTVSDIYVNTVIPPDSHVCDQCLAELFDRNDRRYRYPFINCTNCGPRYSIILDMPYDRNHTTMDEFTMCKPCEGEYSDPNNRRYHAQPNACPGCGPSLSLYGKDRNIINVQDISKTVVQLLLDGAIVAIKGVGGYHIAANPFLEDAVKLLRSRKKRDWKPFALMAANTEILENFVELNPLERARLEDASRPIVLLKRREVSGGGIVESVAPQNPMLGFMLPSTPLHYLLLENKAMPVLVMTSGNISGHPICQNNQEALKDLPQVADYIVTHDRYIKTRVDDSVMRISTHPELDMPITTFFRRSRGFVPRPVVLTGFRGKTLSYGAELKTTISVSSDEQIYISHHIGDLKNDSTFEAHQQASDHLCKLTKINPERVACDLHPAFRSTKKALTSGFKDVIRVQHHHAHMAACMADNNLKGRTIGVVFDGAGYGLDGTIWGGEFLVGDYSDFEREAHIRPILLLGGDQAVREPVRVALSLLMDTGYDIGECKDRIPAIKGFNQEQLHVYKRMFERCINSVFCSSMGRLFDGVASLLNICTVAEYEAHGPIMMEGLLGRDHGLVAPYDYKMETNDKGISEIDFRQIIKSIVNDVMQGVDAAGISRRFHSTIVDIVVNQCRMLRKKYEIDQVVLSGGVFLNEYLLVNSMVRLRREGFNANCHRLLPTNDGGISVGQIAVAQFQNK